MKKALLPVLALGLVFSGHVFAEDQAPAATEGETKMKIEDAANKTNKVSGDIDEEITNKKLRAESGSKSKLSVSFTANYYGASLEKPMDKNRPNPTQDPTPPRVRLGGDIGLRYRLDKGQSLSAGTGYSLERPFHEAKRGDVSTPYLTYNNVRKIGTVQNVADASISAATDSDDRELGAVGTLSLGDTLVYDFNGSASSIGMAMAVWYQVFDKYNDTADFGADGAFPAKFQQQDYGMEFYPFYEYVFNDTFNFRTVFRPWMFYHKRTEVQADEFAKRPWTQSVGLGISVARDVFLYPNFQFDWERWRRDDFNFGRKNTRSTSTVGMSATINVF